MCKVSSQMLVTWQQGMLQHSTDMTVKRRFGVIGSPDYCNTLPEPHGKCVTTVGPNNNTEADGMASVLGHELSEAGQLNAITSSKTASMSQRHFFHSCINLTYALLVGSQLLTPTLMHGERPGRESGFLSYSILQQDCLAGPELHLCVVSVAATAMLNRSGPQTKCKQPFCASPHLK